MKKQSESHVFYITGWQNSYEIVDRAEGIYIYDKDGNRYLDGIAGANIVSIGHGVPEVVEAIAEQTRKFCFADKFRFTNEPMEELADLIAAMAPEGMEHIAFSTGGSTGNEMAIQMAHYYQIERGNSKKYKIIGRWHSYHGRTIATLATSGNLFVRRNQAHELIQFPHIQPPHCYQCPFKLTYPSCELACANELARTIEQEGPDTVAAFIAEPIIGGTGGAIVPPPGYYEKIREICDFYDILFIAEEVMTGFGRTGKNFGIQHWNAVPDIITTSKALSGGYAPIGAVIVHDKVYETFINGKRKGVPTIFTYAGHPISCAAALAVQKYVAKHNLIERGVVIGEYLKNGLKKLAESEPLIGDVRGRGMLLGIEFVKDRQTHKPFPRSMQLTEKIVQTSIQNGLLVRGYFGTGTGVDGDHIGVCPAFTITEGECDELLEILSASIKQVKNSLNLAAS